MSSPELLQLLLEEARAEGLTDNVAYIVFGKCVAEGISDPAEAQQRLINERIRSDVLNTKKRIKDLQELVDQVQQACIHPRNELKIENDSNTGNWDPNDDAYWTNYDCGVCGKHWTEHH